MDLRIRTEGDVTVFAFDGPVTRNDCNALRQAFHEALGAGPRGFVFGFSESAYMDSAAIGETVACLKRARQDGGDLKVVTAHDGQVGRLLVLTGLDRVFETYGDEPTALRSYSGTTG